MKLHQMISAGILILGSATVSAQTAYVWTSNADTDWSNAANWSGGLVPASLSAAGATSDSITFSGSVLPTSNIPTYQSGFQDTIPMTVNSGGSLTLDFSSNFNSSMWANSSRTQLTVGDGVNPVTVNVDNMTFYARNGVTSTYQVNAGSTLNINGNLNQYPDGDANKVGVFNIADGASMVVDGSVVMGIGTKGKINLNDGGTLSVTQNMNYNDPDNAVFTVGTGSTLNLGNTTHTFDHGLTIANTGTLGSGNNSATPATSITGGAVTLQSGAIIDYSINGTGGISDEWAVSSLNLNPAGSYSLVVDVVSGDVKQSADPWVVFDSGSAITDFTAANWTITAAEGTRLASTGTLLVNPLDNTQLILSGFEAFAIPEPSTAMLLGMGAMVMFLRRRIRK